MTFKKIVYPSLFLSNKLMKYSSPFTVINEASPWGLEPLKYKLTGNYQDDKPTKIEYIKITGGSLPQ
jgi:hypothetical protein